jgi:hypothetical protein
MNAAWLSQPDCSSSGFEWSYSGPERRRMRVKLLAALVALAAAGVAWLVVIDALRRTL